MMRITNNTIVRNYTRNLNSSLSALNKTSEQLSSQRKYSFMHEDTASGVRALQIRRALAQSESYLDTAKTVKSQLASAEGQMMTIGELGKDIATRYTNALNGTNGQDDLEIFAREIEAFRDQILTCANGRFSDRYLFGGTNTTEAPFTVDSDGNLLYQGVSVADMADENGNVKPEYAHLMNDSYSVDIGYGLRSDANGVIVETSTFKASLNGLDYLGIGDKNIYQVCNEMIDALRSGAFTNNDYTAGLLDKMTDAYNAVTLEITNLGCMDQSLDYTISRLEADMLNLIERQDAVEFIDPADAIMQFKMQEYVYNAALSMGSRVLQPTLFQFLS